jgi:hypothetical protein
MSVALDPHITATPPYEVAVDRVTLGSRLRPLDEARVRDLAASMAIQGLLQPIVVTRSSLLLAGAHRLAAARLLGWPRIPVIVLDVPPGPAAALVEIDENLVRNDLTVLEQAEHLVRRDTILRELGLRAPSHRPPKGATVAGFTRTADVAAQAGLSERAVQGRMQIARALPADVRDVLRGTAVANATRTLLELAQVGDPVEQFRIAGLLASGRADDVSEARARSASARGSQRDRGSPASAAVAAARLPGDPVDAWVAIDRASSRALAAVREACAELGEPEAAAANIAAADLLQAVSLRLRSAAAGPVEPDEDAEDAAEVDEEPVRLSLPEWPAVDRDLIAPPNPDRLPDWVRRRLRDLQMTLLPTPTRHCGTTVGNGREGRPQRPSLPNLVGGCPDPRLYEFLLGAPEGWTDPSRRDLRVPNSTGPAALRCVSVCSGVGLGDLGVAQAAADLGLPLRHVAMIERDAWCADLLALRFPGVPVLGDVRSPWTLGRIRDLLGEGGADILLATPPCTPYSWARASREGLGEEHAEFLDVLRVIEAARAKVVILENVYGMLVAHGGRHARRLVKGLEGLGYEVRLRVVEAADLGGLHRRPRALFVGRRRGAPGAAERAILEPCPEQPWRTWAFDPLPENLMLPVGDSLGRTRSSALGAGLCVPVARLVGRYALRLVRRPERGEAAPRV